MNIIKLTTLSLALTASICNVNAQDKNEQSFVHEQSEASDYVWPEDHQVLQNLKHWQDQKFGVLMHWGLYSKAGIVESWSICSEDWIRRERFNDYEKDKQWYWSLKDSLNPIKFNPDLWADVMKKAGMKYMISPPSTTTDSACSTPSTPISLLPTVRLPQSAQERG